MKKALIFVFLRGFFVAFLVICTNICLYYIDISDVDPDWFMRIRIHTICCQTPKTVLQAYIFAPYPFYSLNWHDHEQDDEDL